jgi:hypothetical protein
VLKLLQAKVAERRRIRVANDSEHAALLSGMVVTAGVEEKRHDAVRGARHAARCYSSNCKGLVEHLSW